MCVELFSGSGRLAKKLVKFGFTVGAWDIMHGAAFDLLKRSNVEQLIDRIKANKIAFVHIGLPCQSWSRARRADGRGPPPLRDDGQFLMGLPDLSPKDQGARGQPVACEFPSDSESLHSDRYPMDS